MPDQEVIKTPETYAPCDLQQLKSTPDPHFDVDHLKSDLGRRSAHGALVTFGSQGFRFLIQLGGNIVLARLLSPQDYGLVGMVAALTGLLLVFGNLGLSSAIIQRAKIDQKQMSTLFWLNAALGLALSLVTALLSPAVAWFYHDSRLILITAVSGIGFFITGLGVQHGALLRRQMRFGTLSAIDVASGMVALISGVAMALLQFGYWSLVWMQIFAAITVSVASWVVCAWRPGLPSRKAGIRSMVIFGGNLTFFNALNYFVRNLDNVLIGWRWGAGNLGQYAKAYSLLLFPILQINGPISNAAVPALSRLQSEPGRYRSYYLRGLSLIAYITIPLIIGLGVFSKEIVAIVLGPQWSEAGNLFRILAFAAVLQPMANTTGWLFTSLDRADAMARWGMISAPCYVASFFLGLPWGAAGVATSYAVATWVMMYPCFALAVRDTPVSIKDIFNCCIRPVTLGGLAGAAMIACRTAFADDGYLVMLAAAALATVLVILLVRGLSRSVRSDLDEIVTTIRMSRSPVA